MKRPPDKFTLKDSKVNLKSPRADHTYRLSTGAAQQLDRPVKATRDCFASGKPCQRPIVHCERWRMSINPGGELECAVRNAHQDSIVLEKALKSHGSREPLAIIVRWNTHPREKGVNA